MQRAALALTLALAASPAAGQDVITGPATAIDGHTLDVGGVRIRLAGIEAPSKGEPWFEEAKEALQRMSEGDPAVCEPLYEDSQSRIVATCTIGSFDMGWLMLLDGHARHLAEETCEARWLDICIDYLSAQREARERGLGVWAE